ncbi:hypothetical protein LZ683_14355 [Comamonas testosteroni]|uniref:hypothetical protein n=1 Tax=Comamonas testosteroni TaxID=285 RepID=UPI0023AA748A|nr:hypothetical protein [Comamonas testosteroni]WEE75374.1 hypothetical protein LZ683_14355 [Comamonas testosteroni]
MKSTTLLSSLNAIRAKTIGLFDRPDTIGPTECRELIDCLDAVPGLKEFECANRLLDDLRRSVGGEPFSLRETREYFNAPASDTLVSIFSAPYAKPLGLEYLKFDLLPADPALSRYATNVMPIVLQEATDGLLPAHTVALFPENHIGMLQQPGDKIYYLINKFAARHYKLTQRIIEHLTTADSFREIRGASYEEIEKATVYWVWLHEYNHQRVGDLPIPAFLKLKSSRALAGLEELRVDIGSALILLDDAASFDGKSGFLFEFILAERLLRYGVDGVTFDASGRSSPSYDALSSYMFFNLLSKYRALELVNGRIRLLGNFICALRAILAEIRVVEARIHDAPLEQVREEMLDFVFRSLKAADTVNHYRHAHYDDMRARLRLLDVEVEMP